VGGIVQLVRLFTSITGLSLAPWMGPVALLVAGVLLWPWISVNIRTGDARKLMVQAARERGEERVRLETKALDMVGNGPDGLVMIAKTAVEQGRKELAARAVDKLRATKKRLPDLRRLERELEPPLPGTSAEAALLVERLLGTGMDAEARARLAQARRKWPFDDELEALVEVVSQPPPAQERGEA
jgi:hypothetical protein